MKKTLITLLAISGISYGFTYSEANTWLQATLVDDITSYTITFQIDNNWSKAGGENIFTFGDDWHIRHEVGRYMGLSTDGSSVDGSYASRDGSDATYTINLDELDAYNKWFFDGSKGNNGNGLKGVTVEISMGHGADGRLYGSVTAKDIAEELKKLLSVDIDKRKIQMKETIKAYGSYDVELKILADISAKFVVRVHD